MLISHHAICGALQLMAPMGTIALLIRIFKQSVTQLHRVHRWIFVTMLIFKYLESNHNFAEISQRIHC